MPNSAFDTLAVLQQAERIRSKNLPIKHDAEYGRWLKQPDVPEFPFQCRIRGDKDRSRPRLVILTSKKQRNGPKVALLKDYLEKKLQKTVNFDELAGFIAKFTREKAMFIDWVSPPGFVWVGASLLRLEGHHSRPVPKKAPKKAHERAHSTKGAQ